MVYFCAYYNYLGDRFRLIEEKRMKIVNLETFLKLPVGTVFSNYIPQLFGGLKIKGESWPSNNDFLYQNLIGNIKCDHAGEFVEQCEAAENNKSVDLDFYCMERNGLFDDNQLFAVYESEDLDKLIVRLATAREESTMEEK